LPSRLLSAALLLGTLAAIAVPGAEGREASTSAPESPASTVEAMGTGPASRWRPLAPSPLARTEVTAASVRRSIYVIGGYTSGGAPTAAVERYDTETGRWELVAPMPVALNHAAAVSYRGQLYVVGGYTGLPFSLGIGFGPVASASRGFYRYDPATNRWSKMPPAPTPRGGSAAAVYKDKLLLAGGADELQPLRRFEIFDFRRNAWSTGPPMPLATEHTAGAVSQHGFYVIGGRPAYGRPNYTDVQKYRIRRDRWRRVAPLARGRGGFAAATVCGRPVAFGGEDPRSGPPGTIAEVERFFPRRRAWRPLPPMLTPRHGLGGASVGRTIYAMEGGDVTFAAVTNVAESLRVPCRSQGH